MISGHQLTALQENVEEYVGSKDGAVEGIIKTFQETSSYVPFSLAVS